MCGLLDEQAEWFALCTQRHEVATATRRAAVLRHAVAIVRHSELHERHRHRREVVIALLIQPAHPAGHRPGLRTRTMGEERARRPRPGGAARLSLNGSAQALQERPDFPVQLMVLHDVSSFYFPRPSWLLGQFIFQIAPYL